MKISIPDDLRQEILDCQSSLREQLASAGSSNEKTASDLAGLEAEREKLAVEIVELKQAALNSSRAAAKLLERERRQDLIADRIRELTEARDSAVPLNLGQAKEVLQNVVRFYRSALPDAFADHNREFFSDRKQALQRATLADAVMVFSRILSIAYSLETTSADSTYYGLVDKIFERALRGQPHLGFDHAATEPEAAHES